jgi:putative transposase
LGFHLPQKLAPPRPIEYCESLFNDRKLAMATAYLSGHYTLEEVGTQFKVSDATVSRAVKANEENVKM